MIKVLAEINYLTEEGKRIYLQQSFFLTKIALNIFQKKLPMLLIAFIDISFMDF